jgi:hypothetical protein
MSTTSRGKGRTALYATGASLALVLYLTAIQPAKAQSTPDVGYKMLRVGGGGMRDPLYITKVTVDGKEMVLGARLPADRKSSLILPGRPFQAGSDWLRSLTIFLKNRTDKTMVFIDIPIGFPETGNGRTEPQTIYDIKLGRLPAADAFDARTRKPIAIPPSVKPLSLGPGQKISVHVSDYIGQIKAYVERLMPLMMVTKCTIYGTRGCFEDGICWAGNSFSTPDPDHPGRSKPLGPNYFPGDPHKYWPPGD